MAISASSVKELRELSGAGMLDCKKALEQTNGNIEEAVDFLRKKGIGKAAKKVDRLASEGLVGFLVQDGVGALAEVNSETDFVAKNEGFQTLVKDIVTHVSKNDFADVDALSKSEIEGTVFSEYLPTKASVIGENIVMRRFAKQKANSGEIVNGYCHNAKIGVLLKASYAGDSRDQVMDLLKKVSMHAASMAPKCLNPEDVSQEFLDKEIEIAKEGLKKEGKPENIWDKILNGKTDKLKQDNSLMGQMYVMDNKLKVSQVIANASKEFGEIKITEYVRFELGEGLEKKSENFADEVAQQLG